MTILLALVDEVSCQKGGAKGAMRGRGKGGGRAGGGRRQGGGGGDDGEDEDINLNLGGRPGKCIGLCYLR